MDETPTVQDLTDLERVRVSDKQEAMAIALEERIKQNRIERERCDFRIAVCLELLKKPGAIKAEIEKTIACWQRIRQYHVDARQLAERMLRDISV